MFAVCHLVESGVVGWQPQFSICLNIDESLLSAIWSIQGW